MSIKLYVEELEYTQEEIKKNNERNRILRNRCNELKTYIKEFLDEKGQVGLKYNGKVVILQNKQKRYIKGKNEREADVTKFLTGLGISNPKDVYNKIEDLSKKDYTDKCEIKVQKIKNDTV